jgi:hypothetical protein
LHFAGSVEHRRLIQGAFCITAVAGTRRPN